MGITVEDIDQLLADFQWLKDHPKPQRPRRKSGLWDKAEHDAFDGPLPAVMLYNQLDPGYTRAEQEYPEALKKWEKESAPVRKRLDLGLVCVKKALPYWSEMPNASWYPVKTLETYRRALSCLQPALDEVIQDLERIQAKLSRAQSPPAEKDPAGAEPRSTDKATKQPKRGKDWYNSKVYDYLEENKELYKHLHDKCTQGVGNKEAQREYQQNFGPTAIAKKLGIDKRAVEKTAIYKKFFQPPLHGERALGSEEQGDAPDSDIREAYKRAGGRK